MAGGHFKGLRSPDSGFAVPQHPAAQATVSSLTEVLVNRNDFFFFFADEQKPKKTLWDGRQGTIGYSCKAGASQHHGQLPRSHWDDYRTKKGAKAELIFSPSHSRGA